MTGSYLFCGDLPVRRSSAWPTGSRSFQGPTRSAFLERPDDSVQAASGGRLVLRSMRIPELTTG